MKDLIFKKIFIFIISFTSLRSYAEHLHLLDPISVEKIPEWNQNIKYILECRELIEVPATLLCLTTSYNLLAELMGRVSYYSEAKPQYNIAAHNDTVYLQSDQRFYLGHDIKPQDLVNFYKDANLKCKENDSYCLNQYEKELEKYIFESQKTNYVTLALEAKTNIFFQVLTHEILHAQYFTSSTYREKIKDFWQNQISSSDKEQITKSLSKVYNISDEFLLLNEFQAYLLEYQSETGFFNVFVNKYKNKLQFALKEHLLNFSNYSN